MVYFLFARNNGFYENGGFQNVQVGEEYDEVVSKSGKSDIMLKND